MRYCLNIGDFMKEKKLRRRNTSQKQTIITTLHDCGSHLSAGEVWREVQKTAPSIGRATVFRVLATAADDGNLLRIHKENGDIFDTTTAPHAHVVCKNCGAIGDVWLDGSVTDCVRDTSGFSLEDAQLSFTGICPKCAEKAEKDQNKQ